MTRTDSPPRPTRINCETCSAPYDQATGKGGMPLSITRTCHCPPPDTAA